MSGQYIPPAHKNWQLRRGPTETNIPAIHSLLHLRKHLHHALQHHESRTLNPPPSSLNSPHPHLSTPPTLFLDIDGVLAVPSAKQVRRKHWYDESTYPFTPACVKLLNALLRTTGAEIVLSSTWRLHYTLPELDAIFRWNGAIRTPKDITPEMGNRDVEIRHFVQEHHIQQFLIIDDLPLTCYPDRFVQTDGHRGITEADLLRGIEILDSQNR